MGATVLKWQQAAFLSGGCAENPFLCLSLVSRGRPHSLAPGPFLLQCQQWSVKSSPHGFTLTPIYDSLFHKDPCDILGPPRYSYFLTQGLTI